MEKNYILIFPHQLFENHHLINKNSTLFLVEDPHFFYRFNFHKQKLVFHRATMQEYAHMLKKRGVNVIYFDHHLCKKNPEIVFIFCKENKIHHLNYFDLADEILHQRLHAESKKYNIEIIEHTSPSFFLSKEEVSQILGVKKNYRMASFYTKMRKKFKILVKNNKPFMNKWSFDEENRLKFSQATKSVSLAKENKSIIVEHAKNYIEIDFSNNPGDTTNFIYPINHQEAQIHLKKFISKNLNNFGPYQDAFDEHELFGFHSLLSPLLNVGLLLPDQVVQEVLFYIEKKEYKINSIEGFIRQILGWREFVRGIYVLHGSKQKNSNIFNHKNRLSKSFWDGTTTIKPIDVVIKKTLAYAYAHHIERLMVLGNFMLLTEINPNDVYSWFMEMYIDAYDWVMIPNIYGMSQYSDDGIMTSKPYCSSSKYILAMSHYKKEEWTSLWDSLYWNFIRKNYKKLLTIPRFKFMLSIFNKIKKETIQKHVLIAQNYLNTLSNNS